MRAILIVDTPSSRGARYPELLRELTHSSLLEVVRSTEDVGEMMRQSEQPVDIKRNREAGGLCYEANR